MVARIRSFTEMPIGVGFGISDPRQVLEVAECADAVIVGSPYGGPYGVMARRWLDEKPLPEIEGIKAVVADCFANYDVRLMGKLHGGQTYDNPPVWDFRVFDLQLRKLIPDRVSDEHVGQKSCCCGDGRDQCGAISTSE